MNVLFANFADGHHMDEVEDRENQQVCNVKLRSFHKDYL